MMLLILFITILENGLIIWKHKSFQVKPLHGSCVLQVINHMMEGSMVIDINVRAGNMSL